MDEGRPKFIIRSKPTVHRVVTPGDLVQICIRHGHEKRGNWRSPLVVQGVDHTFGTLMFL